MKKRLYLVIENYNRELESRVYLAIRAAELGWSVVIGNKANIVKQIKNLHSGVFFIKSVGPKNVEIINLLKEYGNKIVATDEENIVFFGDNHLLTRMNHNCLSQLDSFYCWGQREFEYLERLYPKFKNKFFITGNPRIDILKAPLNKKYVKEASILKKKIGKFILLNSGFGKVIRASKTDWVEDAINAGKLDTEDKIENEKRAVNYERLNLNGFVELINFLTDKLPSTKFILRPHPAEDPDWWRKTFKNIKNLDVNVEKISTNVFIGASEFLIAHNCITLLEAYFLKKRSINFICHKDKRYEHELISKCSQIINDKEKILNFINKDKSNLDLKVNKDDIFYSIFNSEEKINSVDKILDNLTLLFNEQEFKNFKDKNLPKSFLWQKIKSYLYQLYNFFRVYYDLIIKRDRSRLILYTIAKNKRGRLITKDIKNHLDKYTEILNYKNNIKVFELYKGLFCIEKNNQ